MTFSDWTTTADQQGFTSPVIYTVVGSGDTEAGARAGTYHSAADGSSTVHDITGPGGQRGVSAALRSEVASYHFSDTPAADDGSFTRVDMVQNIASFTVTGWELSPYSKPPEMHGLVLGVDYDYIPGTDGEIVQWESPTSTWDHHDPVTGYAQAGSTDYLGTRVGWFSGATTYPASTNPAEAGETNPVAVTTMPSYGLGALANHFPAGTAATVSPFGYFTFTPTTASFTVAAQPDWLGTGGGDVPVPSGVGGDTGYQWILDVFLATGPGQPQGVSSWFTLPRFRYWKPGKGIPLRQVQRDDGLARSVPRASRGHSRQMTPRARGYL